MAQSAGTMMELSADHIHMNPFDVMGPTDPQITIMHDKCEYNNSSQLYNNLENYLDKIEINLESCLVMLDTR